ncbi:MAG: hypothetical protein PWQ74_576 [Methanobacteriaceae archaeon]|nr:hypothetical protein [Methanobacteriaceae archaeon]
MLLRPARKYPAPTNDTRIMIPATAYTGNPELVPDTPPALLTS